MLKYTYRIQGTAALKPEPYRRANVKLIPLEESQEGAISKMADIYFEDVDNFSVTAVLDDFEGRMIARTRNDRIFACCAGALGAFALFFLSFGCFF